MYSGRLHGKVALITGAAKGIGAAIAQTFAAQGANVIIGDLHEAGTSALADEIQASGGRAVPLKLEVTSESDWHSAIAIAEERSGGLTTLIDRKRDGRGKSGSVREAL